MMTNILILADHEAGKVAKTAAELATFAKRGGSPLAVLLAPAGQADALGSQLANTEIEKVIAVESDDFARHGIAAMVDALAQIIESQKPSAVLIASSARGKEIAFGRWDIRETAATILLKMREYRPLSVGIERGSLKNAVLPYLSDLMRKNNVYSHIVDLTHGNRKKTDRIIWSLQGRFEHGRIVLNSEEDWDEFKDQLLMFPAQGVHDDLPDSLSYIDQLAVTSYFQDDQEDEWEPLDVISGV